MKEIGELIPPQRQTPIALVNCELNMVKGERL
jgi:hypothetical protein